MITFIRGFGLSIFFISLSVLAVEKSQAPNASEVAKAYQQYADNLSRLQNRLVSKGTGQDAVLAPDHHYQVVEAKLQTCEKAVGQPGFVCITQLVERLPGMQQTNQRWTEDRLVWMNGEWRVLPLSNARVNY